MATIQRTARTGRRSHRADVDLCTRLRDGDHEALSELLEREWSHLVSYAEHLTRDPDDAEEMAQRAFVRLWRRRKHLDSDGSVRALLYRTTRNLCIDLDRKRTTRRGLRGQLRRRNRPPTPYERLRERELRGAIEEAIDALSPRRREAFRLCRLHGLSHVEAADAMDLSPQTVSNHVTHALKQIRAALTPRLD